MATYRATMERRWAEEHAQRAARKSSAWLIAHQAADLLCQQFGATQVVLFGSLAHGRWFTQTSDIDLAAWGIQDADYFLAVARLQDLSPEFSIDLVQMERCRPTLVTAIQREGLIL
jgi:predicted nucleotidyltransferase